MTNKWLILAFAATSILAADVTEVTGKVFYDGKAPRPKKVNMNADPICGKSHSGPVFNESFLINEDNFLQNVMVWVNNPKHSADVPSNPIELDQVGCKYIPHVTGIMLSLIHI